MVKEINKKIEQIYYFNGSKFVDYINMDGFRERIKVELNLVFETESLSEIFSTVVLRHPNKKNELDKIFFESIMYSDLKNVYLRTLGEKIDVSLLKSRMKALINRINVKETIPLALQPAMSEDGFYLMDSLNITSFGTKFISGLDYVIEGGNLKQVRLLLTEVIPVKDRIEYFISGIDINFENDTCLIMIKNKMDITKLEDEGLSSAIDKTVNALYKTTMELVVNPLIFTDDIQVENDRKAMFEFCNYLDTELLKEIRDTVFQQTNRNVSLSVKELIKDLFPNGDNSSVSDKKSLEENFISLLIGLYVKTNYKGGKLKRRAKAMNLVGFPTKIKYTTNKATRGATQSASSSHPVSTSDMFHSLYISFKEALSLEQWSISWFTDYTFSTKDIDVIQTTIYCKSTSFLIIFKPTRALNKEIIYHVVNSLNYYRTR